MKRPIAIVTIGAIIGIIGGMYLKISTILLFLPCAFLILLTLKKTQIRYIKIIMPISAIILFTTSFLMFYGYTKYISNKYELIKEGKSEDIIVTIKSTPIEKEYVFSYIVKVEKLQGLKNIYCNLYVKKEKNSKIFSYGEIVKLTGEIKIPTEIRNYGGFNQKLYYKTKGIYGTIYTTSMEKVGQEKWNIGKLGNTIRENISAKLKNILPKENAGILLATLIGDKEEISSKTIEEFQNSSLIHILCVSGSHVSFLMLGIQKILEKVGRNNKYLFSFLAIIVLIVITGFSASVARACIMGALIIFSKLVFRRSDNVNAIFVSLLVLLTYNPFLLFDTGLLLSYGGTIGIIIFNKLFEEKIPKGCGKLKSYILKTALVSCSAQIVLFPIIAYLFQSFQPVFLISNLIAAPLFEGILYLGCCVLILSYIFEPIVMPIAGILNVLLTVFKKIAEVSSKIPYGVIKIVKPNNLEIILYYFLIIVLRYSYIVQNKKIVLRYYERKYKKIISKLNLKNAICITIMALLIFQVVRLIPGDLNIYFIDVGQGDSTLIKTRFNKTILIDSGGTEDLEKYDVGKKVLVPYLLARGIKKLDYIFVSHFHADHCNGFLAVMEELQVDTLLMAEQQKMCEEANKILELAKKKHVNIVYLKQGQVVSLDNETKIEILYIGEDMENLNNNSIIARLKYNNFSMLFTGDSETEEEQEFLKKYKKQKMKINILKVGHHGSATSSCEEFLNKLTPSIALIGVGEDNNFGHPNKAVLDRLKKIGAKIYRTDEMGEITIKVKKSGKILIKTSIKK